MQQLMDDQPCYTPMFHDKYYYVVGLCQANSEVPVIPYIGRFSGQPVRFERLSDAERLCQVLNERVRPNL